MTDPPVPSDARPRVTSDDPDEAAQWARRRALREIAGRGGDEAIAALEAAVADPGSLVRAEVAYQLGVSKHPRADDLLDVLASDPQVVVRHAVVEGIVELGSPRARALLLRFGVRDPSEDVRGATARALGEMNDPRADEALEQMAREDPDDNIRRIASEGLASRRGR